MSDFNCIYCHHLVETADYLSKITATGTMCSFCKTYYYIYKSKLQWISFWQDNFRLTIDVKVNKIGVYARCKDGNNQEQILCINHLLWIFPSTVSYWINRAKNMVAFS